VYCPVLIITHFGDRICPCSQAKNKADTDLGQIGKSIVNSGSRSHSGPIRENYNVRRYIHRAFLYN
jgi:hypothetical protein